MSSDMISAQRMFQNQGASSESSEERERRQREAVERHERHQALYREVLAEVMTLPLSAVRERIVASALTARDGYALVAVGETLKLLDDLANSVAAMDDRLREEASLQMRDGVLRGTVAGLGLGSIGRGVA